MRLAAQSRRAQTAARSYCAVLAWMLAAGGLPATASADEAKRVAPYAVSQDSVVDAMLTLAGVSAGDYVVDLGSGDGRLVIAAAKKFGARGLGVDIDARLVATARSQAESAGVADRVHFREQDLFETDLAQASVVTVYLFPSIMDKVGRKLDAELAPGTRVVSHDFPIPGWRIERIESLDVPEKRDYTWNERATLYYYRMPARR